MNKYQHKLKFLIDRSNYLYQLYRVNNVYINALLIKSVNKEIIEFLLSNGYKFNNDLEINKILNHFEVWYYQFIEHEKSINSLSNKFVFRRIDQATDYPKQAIESVLKKNKDK